MKKATGRSNVIGKILGILLMCLVTGGMFSGLPGIVNAELDEVVYYFDPNNGDPNIDPKYNRNSPWGIALNTLPEYNGYHLPAKEGYIAYENQYDFIDDSVKPWNYRPDPTDGNGYYINTLSPDKGHWFWGGGWVGDPSGWLPGASDHVQGLREPYNSPSGKGAKVYIYAPWSGKACIAVIGDNGPAPWTGRQFGVSNKVFEALGLPKTYARADGRTFDRGNPNPGHAPDKNTNPSDYPVIKYADNPYWVEFSWADPDLPPGPATLKGVEPGWPAGKPNICRKPTDGFIDFEDGTDGAVIRSTIPGLKFTTTLGLDWIYGDIQTGKYNVYPYGDQSYETNGNFFAWLGVTGDQGRIDFPQGTATYLSVLVSTYSGVKIDAYDAEGNFLATSGWAENNLHTRTFTRLTVEAPGMAYVIVHDTGNYWLIDDLCTDAPGVLRAHYEAAELAKAVIGKNYLTQLYNVFTKGWKDGKFVETGEVEYLDCSGLVFWSYNKAYSAEKYLGKGNPVTYEGADGQYQNNFDVTVSEDELLPGDVLFFDWDSDGYMDHVAMYVGEYKWKGEIQKLEYYTTGGVLRQKASQPIVMTEKIGTVEYDGTYNVVHASGDAGYSYGIRPDTVDRLKMLDGFVEFRRLTEPKVGAEFKSYSPVDLIVTDPDGFTITKEIHEIPGVLYYSEWDIDGDGELDDMVIVPERKIGDYLITVVPEPEASPTDTYCLEVSADGETVVLAEGVQISDVPSQPYIIESTETEEFYVWQYVFEDSYGRGTKLKINTEHKFFQFITPDKDFGVKYDPHMTVSIRYRHHGTELETKIKIRYKDSDIRLHANIRIRSDHKDKEKCSAKARDMQTGKKYHLKFKT